MRATSNQRRSTRLRRGAVKDTSGASAVEFALITPIFLLILVGTLDFGGVLFTEFGLNGAISAAADFALINAGNVNATGGPALATQLVGIASSAHASNWASATAVVNNGPTATGNSTTATAGGTAANAAYYYCPTISGSTIVWGAAVAKGYACANGSLSGQFVTITATRTYTPLFGSYGIVKNNALSASTVVQVQ
jgi:Flp pilus assembly protein TadG